MRSFLCLVSLLVFVLVSDAVSITNLALQYPTFTIQNPSGGFFVQQQNEVILTETGSGDISSISLTSPLSSATPYHSFVLPYMTSLNLLTQTTSQGGQIRFDNVDGLALRPQGNSWFSLLGNMDWNTFVNLDSDNLQNIDNYNQNAIPQSQMNGASFSAGSVIAVWNVFPQPAVPWNYAKLFIYASSPGSSLSLYWVCYTLGSRKTVLGTGWQNPTDVKPNGDNSVWWVADATGVYQVSSASPSKNAASLVIPAVDPSALVYDLNTHLLYCVENRPLVGRIWVWNGLTASILYGAVQSGEGISLLGSSSSSLFLLISEGGTNSVFQFNLQTSTKNTQGTVVGLSQPQQVTASNSNSWQVYVVDSVGVHLLDYSVPTSPTTTLLFAIQSATTALSLTSGSLGVFGGNFFSVATLPSYSSSGPLFLGIGFVPVTKINSNGYATVTDPGYPIYCVDAPFGATFTLLINHPGAWKQGATHYAIWIAGQWIGSSFGDQKWGFNSQTQTNQFIYTLTSPSVWDNSGRYFYPLRLPSDLWLNPFWGAVIDSSIAPNGLNGLYVEFYNVNTGSSPVAINWITYTYTPLMIDNVYPQASINQIYNVNHGILTPVGACAIVTGNSSLFAFNITAADPDNHFLSYSLYSVWGVNKAGSIASDVYANHLSGAPLWSGVYSTLVPLGNNYWNANYPGDFSSVMCAHSFILYVYDRTINGWNLIHETSYSESLTLMLFL